MFITILYGFGMIWLQLTRTDAVFSRTTWCCFLCRNKSSPNAAKLFDDFFWKETDPGRFGGAPEEPQGPHKPPGRTNPPLGAPWCLVGPLWPLFAWFQRQKFRYIPKPLEITLELWLRRRKPLYRSDLIRSPIPSLCRRGESSPEAIFIIPAVSMTRRE